MQRIRTLTFLAMSIGLFGQLEALAATPNEWPFSLDFSSYPEENLPAWKRAGAGEVHLEEGRLRLQSDLEGGIAYTLAGGIGDAVWDSTKPTTLRFRVRVVDSIDGPIGGHVTVRRGEKVFVIPLIDREERTYQFLIGEGDEARLFIDGMEQAPIRARPHSGRGPDNAVMFGDLGGAIGGETEWTEFSWTNEGTFEP